MKSKILKYIFSVSVCVVCAICSFITAYASEYEYEAQGTEGDELQVAEASQLEIQLGDDWGGVEFVLRTDAGLYPDTIPVGDDGVLRLEIGGSSSYVLSPYQSEPEVQDAALQNDVDAENQSDNLNQSGEVSEQRTVAGIPIAHIAILAGGIILASAILVVIRVVGRYRSDEYDDEDEDDDEEYE